MAVDVSTCPICAAYKWGENPALADFKELPFKKKEELHSFSPFKKRRG